MFQNNVSIDMHMIKHVGFGCLMMHDMRDLQCLNVGITPGCYKHPNHACIILHIITETLLRNIRNMLVKHECCIHLFRVIFAQSMLARISKTCLAMIVNHLELFSTIFGARFVFKLLPNFALKIILQN